MSHPTVWRCRACRAPLGVVGRDGALEVHVSSIAIGRDGRARVPCPACGTVREWWPSPAAPTWLEPGSARNGQAEG